MVVPEATDSATVASEEEGRFRRRMRAVDRRMKKFIVSLHCYASLD